MSGNNSVLETADHRIIHTALEISLVGNDLLPYPSCSHCRNLGYDGGTMRTERVPW